MKSLRLEQHPLSEPSERRQLVYEPSGRRSVQLHFLCFLSGHDNETKGLREGGPPRCAWRLAYKHQQMLISASQRRYFEV
jgi:hypothetical protein